MKRKFVGSRVEARRQKRGFSGGGGAFSLIELLVVIAILSILAALLLPALSQSKAKALSIVCKNNEHEMGLALNMYVADFHFYPYANTTNGPYLMFWYQALVPYYPPGAFGNIETGAGGY